MQRVQKKYQTIYEYLGGDVAPDLRQAEIRRPIISCLKKSLSNLDGILYNFKDYTITKDEYGTLKVALEQDAQYLYQANNGYTQLAKTELFEKVLKI